MVHVCRLTAILKSTLVLPAAYGLFLRISLTIIGGPATETSFVARFVALPRGNPNGWEDLADNSAEVPEVDLLALRRLVLLVAQQPHVEVHRFLPCPGGNAFNNQMGQLLILHST